MIMNHPRRPLAYGYSVGPRALPLENIFILTEFCHGCIAPGQEKFPKGALPHCPPPHTPRGGVPGWGIIEEPGTP